MQRRSEDRRIRLRYLDALDRQADTMETLLWLLRRLRRLSLLHSLLMVGYYTARGAAIGSTAAPVLLLLFDVPIARADWIPPLAWTLLVLVLKPVTTALEARRERLDRAFRRLLTTQIGTVIVHQESAHDCEVCHHNRSELRSP